MRYVSRSAPLLLLFGAALAGCNPSGKAPPGGYDAEPGKREVVAKVEGMT